MNKDEMVLKQFLLEQLDWCKKQDSILVEIEFKLNEMRNIVHHVIKNELSSIETNKLNNRLNYLKDEVHILEKQLNSQYH